MLTTMPRRLRQMVSSSLASIIAPLCGVALIVGGISSCASPGKPMAERDASEQTAVQSGDSNVVFQSQVETSTEQSAEQSTPVAQSQPAPQPAAPRTVTEQDLYTLENVPNYSAQQGGSVYSQQQAVVVDLRQPIPEFKPRTIPRGNSMWQAVPWNSLPGLYEDNLQGAFGSMVQSCRVSRTALPQLCGEVQALQYAAPDQQLKWLQLRLQPYRVLSKQGNPRGLLTSYYEPVMQASRVRQGAYQVPLYAAPDNLRGGRWFSRQQIETSPQAQQALAGKELVYLSSPIDALILHIQGSGKVYITEPDGTVTQRRMAYAATNNHRYRSVARKLLAQGKITGASWPEIKAWADSSAPQEVQRMLWENPRYVFFKEEALDTALAELGPKGAQGVPLTAGRSIAVDSNSIPYGTPVWLASTGTAAHLQRLVVAQDTGNAIRGAVRADYFAGSGDAAGEFAGRIKQPLMLWVLWPR